MKLPACSARVSAIRNLPRRVFVDDEYDDDVVVDDDDDNDEDWGGGGDGNNDDKDNFNQGRRQINPMVFRVL